MMLRVNRINLWAWFKPNWFFCVASVFLLLIIAIVIQETIALRKQIEQAQHEAQVNRLRAVLVEQWVHRQVQPHTDRNWEGINPMRLMLHEPIRYVGEYELPPHSFREVWFFDRRAKCLVYIFGDGQYAAYRMVDTSLNGERVMMAGGFRLKRISGYPEIVQ